MGHDKHKTITILMDGNLLKVDEEIAPLVKWLNSFEGVSTAQCCQGGGGECPPLEEAPYVVFSGNTTKTLNKVKRELFTATKGFPGPQLKVEESSSCTLRQYFYNRAQLRWIIKKLQLPTPQEEEAKERKAICAECYNPTNNYQVSAVCGNFICELCSGGEPCRACGKWHCIGCRGCQAEITPRA